MEWLDDRSLQSVSKACVSAISFFPVMAMVRCETLSVFTVEAFMAEAFTILETLRGCRLSCRFAYSRCSFRAENIRQSFLPMLIARKSQCTSC